MYYNTLIDDEDEYGVLNIISRIWGENEFLAKRRQPDTDTIETFLQF